MFVIPELSKTIDELLEESQKDLVKLTRELDTEIYSNQLDLDSIIKKAVVPNTELLIIKLTKLMED